MQERLMVQHFKNCNAYNFEYIIGQESAGGYVGRMQPGNVASVVGNADVLGGLLNVEGNLVICSSIIYPNDI